MIGLSLTNSGPAVVPTYGRQAMLGTNPISLAAPAGRHYPFVLDMATSTVAIGKLSVALRWGKPIPPGWALDHEGQPTTDPDRRVRDAASDPARRDPRAGRPQGLRAGRHGRHPGRACSPARPSPTSAGAIPDPTRPDIGHFFGAIDVARFRDLDAFKTDMDDLLQALKDSPKAEGQERIYVAGEPEWESEQRRRREGIPLAPGLVTQLREVSAERRRPVHARRLRRAMPQFAYFCGHEQFQPEVLLEHAVLAESVGFDALTVSDHFHPWVDDASACGFAWTWLGALAVRTRRVRIATAVTCPLFHYHPGLVAQAAATVDRLSGRPLRPRGRHRRGHQRAAARLPVPRATRSARPG